MLLLLWHRCARVRPEPGPHAEAWPGAPPAHPIAPRRWPLVKQAEDELREAIAWAKAHPDSDKKPSAAAVPK